MASSEVATSNSKPKGRMSAYTFFVQKCREEHRRQFPTENVNFSAFSKECSNKWKALNESEKRKFKDLANVDKQRYDREMAGYVPPAAGDAGERRKRHKDPNAPRRPMPAFFHFCGEERAKVRAQRPDITVGDLAKELGSRWANLNEEAKQKYQDQHERDRERYDREKAAYEKDACSPPKQRRKGLRSPKHSKRGAGDN